jgi:hypothetical protein
MTDMKRLLLGAMLMAPALMAAQTASQKITVEVENKAKVAKADAPVVVNLPHLRLDFVPRSAVVTLNGVEIASQLDDLNGDRRADELAFVTDIAAKTKLTFEVTLSEEKTDKKYTPRVYADMKVADKKSGKHAPVHSVTIPGTTNIYSQMYHHGPAFESELVAYRIYFNEKITPDPYGKFHKGLEIEESQFYPTDAQLARGFGDDVLRVGNSCGVGAFKGWNGTEATHMKPVDQMTERIVAYGPIRTVTEVEVNGWQYGSTEFNSVVTRYTLYAGHRDMQVEAFFDRELSGEEFATGAQILKAGTHHSDHKGLVASWGTDWPVNDTVKYAKETVGIATYVPKEYVVKEAQDPINYLYVMTNRGGDYLKYYTMFTSRKETFGYETPEAWFAYAEEWKKELDTPVEVTVKF